MNREEIAEVLYNVNRTHGAAWDKQSDPKHRDRYLALADAVLQHLASQRHGVKKCPASATSDPPQDCDMPFCGCDPAWTEALDAAQESGWLTGAQAAAQGGLVARLGEIVKSAAVFGDGRDQNPTYDKGWNEACLYLHKRLLAELPPSRTP